MVPLVEKTVWREPPGQDAADADRRAYLVEVPTYYSSVAFRDQLAREFGLPPRPAELLQEIAAGLEVLVEDADERGRDRLLLARAILAETSGVALAVADRRRLGALREAARRAWPAYREMEARAGTHDELRTLELVRRFVVDWRGLWSGAGEDAEELRPERNGDYLTREALELVPIEDLVFLRLEIEGLSAPRGQTRKNSERPSSSPTTATPSTTAKSTRRTRPPRKARGGASTTSKTRKRAKATG